MQQQPQDDDEDRVRLRRGPASLRRTKSGKLKKHHQKLDAKQYAMCIGGCLLFSWGLVVTFLLLRLGIMYTFDTIALTREEYSIKGSSAWAKSVASKHVMQAIDVWNLVNASITGLVYQAPQDYTTLGYVLSPAFETMPSLHAVDLAFSDRTSELAVTRQKGAATRGSLSYMQSNSADCFLMGVEGCVTPQKSLPHLGVLRPEWYTFGASLRPTPYGGIFYWALKPELVVEPQPSGADLVSPSIQLIFQAAFPTHRSPSGANTKIVGRITVKVAALGGSTLIDERLGGDGKIYLCDASGAMLASTKPEDLLIVDSGRVRYKYFWELEKASWASGVRSAFSGSSVKEMENDEGDTFIVVEPLDPPLGRFAVIIVVPSIKPFENIALMGTAAIASIVAPAPYAITAGIAFVFFWAQCFTTMTKGKPKDALAEKAIVSATIAKGGTSRQSRNSIMMQRFGRFASFVKRSPHHDFKSFGKSAIEDSGNSGRVTK